MIYSRYKTFIKPNMKLLKAYIPSDKLSHLIVNTIKDDAAQEEYYEFGYVRVHIPNWRLSLLDENEYHEEAFRVSPYLPRTDKYDRIVSSVLNELHQEERSVHKRAKRINSEVEYQGWEEDNDE